MPTKKNETKTETETTLAQASVHDLAREMQSRAAKLAGTDPVETDTSKYEAGSLVRLTAKEAEKLNPKGFWGKNKKWLVPTLTATAAAAAGVAVGAVVGTRSGVEVEGEAELTLVEGGKAANG